MAESLNRRLDIPGQPMGNDDMLGMITALTSELAVLRERLDTIERLTARGETIDLATIEGFVPDAAAQVERDAMRRRIIAKVFRPIKDALARAAGETP